MSFSHSDRIDEYKKMGLGLNRGEVRLVEYSDNWPIIYKREVELITAQLNINSLVLHHCGSTSIPNVIAKPIVDIVGEVDDTSELNDKIQNLASFLKLSFK